MKNFNEMPQPIMLYIIHKNMEVEKTFMINWVFSPSAGSESKEDKSISNGIPHRLTFLGRSLIKACVKGPFAPINFQQQGHCISPEVRTYNGVQSKPPFWLFMK